MQSHRPVDPRPAGARRRWSDAAKVALIDAQRVELKMLSANRSNRVRMGPAPDLGVRMMV